MRFLCHFRDVDMLIGSAARLVTGVREHLDAQAQLC
jgi:hypothetical protein